MAYPTIADDGEVDDDILDAFDRADEDRKQGRCIPCEKVRDELRLVRRGS